MRQGGLWLFLGGRFGGLRRPCDWRFVLSAPAVGTARAERRDAASTAGRMPVRLVVDVTAPAMAVRLHRAAVRFRWPSSSSSRWPPTLSAAVPPSVRDALVVL